MMAAGETTAQERRVPEDQARFVDELAMFAAGYSMPGWLAPVFGVTPEEFGCIASGVSFGLLCGYALATEDCSDFHWYEAGNPKRSAGLLVLTAASLHTDLSKLKEVLRSAKDAGKEDELRETLSKLAEDIRLHTGGNDEGEAQA